MDEKEPVGISETVSKKRKRGRPRAIPEDQWADYNSIGVFNGMKTERSRQNTVLMYRACKILEIDNPEASEPFRWLADIRTMDNKGGKGLRFMILAELGRIEDEEVLRSAALRICELKPRSRHAVALIRGFRLNKSGIGDADGLNRELTRLVNDYLKRYPNTPWKDVIEAVRGLLESVKESAARD